MTTLKNADSKIIIDFFNNDTANDTINREIERKNKNKNSKNKNNKNKKNTSNKIPKISPEDFSILTFDEYEKLNQYNFTLPQLREIAKNYKQLKSGNKKILLERLYNFLKKSFYVRKIQRVFRGYIQRLYNNLSGPAFFKRMLCTNENDFYSMDNIKEISANQFISFKDNDGFIYGFDILSLYNLILKNGLNSQNPYNRSKLPDDIVNIIRLKIRLSIILKNPINIKLDNEIPEQSSKHKLNMRIVSVFQQLDSLGNYTDMSWFSNLNRNKLIHFIRELYDIWSYRAQLSSEVKYNICPPNGNPFRYANLDGLNNPQFNFELIQKISLSIIENMINCGRTTEFKTLGAYYVLSAFTLVSKEAAESLPWLYESVVHL